MQTYYLELWILSLKRYKINNPNVFLIEILLIYLNIYSIATLCKSLLTWL